MCVYTGEHGCRWNPSWECVRFPGAEVTGSCNIPYVGARIKLGSSQRAESALHSWPLSSPWNDYFSNKKWRHSCDQSLKSFLSRSCNSAGKPMVLNYINWLLSRMLLIVPALTLDHVFLAGWLETSLCSWRVWGKR